MVSPPCVLVHGVIPPHGQNFALPFVELHEIPIHTVIHLVEVHSS